MAGRLGSETLKELLECADTLVAIDSALTRFAHINGFDWFSYLSVFGSEVTGLSNYPAEWQERYLSEHLASVDPIVAAIPLHHSAFYWSDSELPIRSTQAHLHFFDQAKGFGIRSGVTIPVAAAFGRRAIVTLASSAYTPRHARIDGFDAISLATFIDAYLRVRHQGLLTSAPCPLTAYQLQCLAWISCGKTSNEIAAMRGVSRRAIEFQLDNIRRRLDAVTTAQAMATALRRRWII